ncbi:hypothetical protein Tco_0584022 [Tanacetum coccineum]
MDFTTLSDTLQARLVVARPKSAKEAWGLISDIVKDNKRSPTNALKAELRSIKLGDQSMESYFQKIESILTSLDSHVNDEEDVHYALECLPDKSLALPVDSSFYSHMVLMAKSGKEKPEQQVSKSSSFVSIHLEKENMLPKTKNNLTRQRKKEMEDLRSHSFLSISFFLPATTFVKETKEDFVCVRVAKRNGREMWALGSTWCVHLDHFLPKTSIFIVSREDMENDENEVNLTVKNRNLGFNNCLICCGEDV